jgi:hypothetical protein
LEKLWIAYWPSQSRAATDNETVINLFFGVFTSKQKAIESVKAGVLVEEWESFHDQFLYEKIEPDRYNPISRV